MASFQFYREYNDNPVYPGHPVTLALNILLVYGNDIPAALERTKHGWASAVGNTEVAGGGGSVRDACDLLRNFYAEDMTPEEAVSWGHHRWHDRTVRGGDHRKKFEEGQAQANRFESELLKRLHSIRQVT